MKDIAAPVPDEFLEHDGGLEGARHAFTRLAVLERVRKDVGQSSRGSSDVDFETETLVVRSGKGAIARRHPMGASVAPAAAAGTLPAPAVGRRSASPSRGKYFR
ncbi:MAG: hypothetical protein FJX76_05770 [Armatimonadetes bacterium]|nr:hypothetical protein [Armatimonadota bacterium]